jgi:quinol-cytochrome oxidoreductase complex cytochrome b subunit
VFGYLLIWGNLGYYALVAIKNLINSFGTILIYFDDFLSYILGMFFIYDSRLLTLHFFLAFILGILVVFHIGILHNFSSINPTTYIIDFIYGFSLTLLKDLLFISFIFYFIFFFILLKPNRLGDSSNLVFVDFLSTPFAIMPE